MPDDTVGHVTGQAVPRVAGENVLARDLFQNRLRFVIQHGVAADFVLRREPGSISQPFADFFAAPVKLNIRCSGDNPLQ